ncbi:MAG TPA: hypothetical protein PLP42_20145 [Acidobacteriota bacterium]|nr:hypothetical protein [Acidobacteriota bacterium]
MEVKRLQEHFFRAVQQEGRISLSNLIAKYGSEVDVHSSASDKNLVKRQMDQLAAQGQIEFHRAGRELIAQLPGRSEKSQTQNSAMAASSPADLTSPVDLAVIRAFAVQVEEFSRTLQEQISTLVRMVEKASR